jgi:hypothetical protein
MGTCWHGGCLCTHSRASIYESSIPTHFFFFFFLFFFLENTKTGEHEANRNRGIFPTFPTLLHCLVGNDRLSWGHVCDCFGHSKRWSNVKHPTVNDCRPYNCLETEIKPDKHLFLNLEIPINSSKFIFKA